MGRASRDRRGRLAALVAAGINAHALVLLSDVPGALTAPPGTAGATRLPVYQGQQVVIGALSPSGRGGTVAKMAAAQVEARGSVHAVIASGFQTNILGDLFAGQDVGTLFPGGLGCPGGAAGWPSPPHHGAQYW